MNKSRKEQIEFASMVIKSAYQNNCRIPNKYFKEFYEIDLSIILEAHRYVNKGLI